MGVFVVSVDTDHSQTAVSWLSLLIVMTPCQMAVFQILPLFESYLFWGLMSPHSTYVYYFGRPRHVLVRKWTCRIVLVIAEYSLGYQDYSFMGCCIVRLGSLVDYDRSEESFRLTWRWRWQVSTKRWWVFTKLRGSMY